MNLLDFDYNLPAELIAQEPEKKRDRSRLLVLDKNTGKIFHHTFYDVLDFLNPEDLIIFNDTKVIPARLIGKKEITHGKVELLLHKQIGDNLWEVLGKNLKLGHRVIFDKSKLMAIPEIKTDDTYTARFNLTGKDLLAEIERIGQMPIPPYIRGGLSGERDKNNYQTVYARKKGSVAAPTAGLHFTKELIKKMKVKGINSDFVTLHVGLGTFAPVKTLDIKNHKMHSEYFEISKELTKKIIKTKKNGGKIIAVGTTTARVLETIYYELYHHRSSPQIHTDNPKIHEDKETSSSKGQTRLSGWTDIFIYPEYKFKVVDGLITNFHLPKSTLLMLVSALAGIENIKSAYAEAIRNNYRFYSYGDAMLIQ